MLRLKPIFTLLLAFCFLAGCTYHGRLKRALYLQPDFSEKIDARVLVVSDEFIDPLFRMEDPGLPYTSFVVRTDDGVAVASADALGTLFTQVEVNPYRYRKNYDYVAEVEYHVMPGFSQKQQYYQAFEEFMQDSYRFRNDHSFLWLKKVHYPYLNTSLKITLRNPKTNQALAIYSTDVCTPYLPNAAGETLTFLSKLTFGLTGPLTSPLYAQIAGHSVRVLLENDLKKGLLKIMQDMAEDYALLFEKNPQQTTARQDEMYRDVMEKTVFLQDDTRFGSGFFISANGYLVTNAHVAGKNRDLEMMTYNDFLARARGEKVPKRYAKVLLINQRRDLALLKTEGTFPYFELDANRTHYQTGAEVVAIGAPLGHPWSVSKGIISATASQLALQGQKGPIKCAEADYLQTDAAINHGNSGGPLVLLKTGKVIGVNSLGEFMENAEGLGFAISAFEVKRTLGITQPLDENALQNRLIKRQSTLGNGIVD